MKPQIFDDDEELEISQAWEAGVLKPVSDMAQHIKTHRAAADATFKKDQRLNIRISSRDLKSLQACARRCPDRSCKYESVVIGIMRPS